MKVDFSLPLSAFNSAVANSKKLLRWGPRGLWSYARDRLRSRSLRRQLRRSLDHELTPIRGVTVVGKLTIKGSNSKTLRDLVMSLAQAEIPYQTFDMSGGESLEMPEFKEYLTPANEFALNRYDHLIEFAPSVVGRIKGVKKSRILFWEFDSGLLYGYPDVPHEDCVIAMSDFNFEYFRRILPHTRVVKLLYPFQCDSRASASDVCGVRQKYGLGPNDFVVYFNFDFGSGYGRKNPEGALKAFAAAFAGEPSAKLLLKTSGAKSCPDKVERLKNLADELGVAERLIFVDSFLSQREVYDLVGAADVYLSLHRGEGFGITLAEAMAMGKPVVCTDWSSTTEFCRPSCCMPVSCRLVVPRSDQVDHPYYKEVREWAEPNLDTAAAALARLYRDPQLRNEIGRRAYMAIREQFSTENFQESVQRFLEN